MDAVENAAGARLSAIPLVSVVIPAFNAAATLRETLQSVSAQTHRHLEIIVVDDGSSDQTAQIAQAYRQTDPRVTLIRQENSGVASARNAGIRVSRAEFVAFIDADDLWHPTKIAKQLARLIASDSKTALVYSPFRQIDKDGRVRGSSRNDRVEGWVINRHFYVNIIGNGSAILIRKHVLEELGGYSDSLLQHKAQGCEDFFLQLRVALRYRFATVPEYLVGYRASGAMSSNEERMLRSALLSMSMTLAECPGFPELATRGLVAWKIWEYLKVVALRRQFREGAAFIRDFLKGREAAIANAAWIDVNTKIRGIGRRLSTLDVRRRQAKSLIAYRHFYDYAPADMNYADHLPVAPGKIKSDRVYRALEKLEPLDAAYRPEKYFARNYAPAPERSPQPAVRPEAISR